MRHILILFFLISWLAPSYTQEKKLVQISGIITSTEGDLLPFTHIIITNRQLGTIADEKGMFSFVAEVNDSLIFSSVGFKQQGYIIPDNLREPYINVEIELIRDTIYLSEVEIYPWATYEEFKEAFINLELPDDDLARANKNIALIKEQIYFAYEGTPDPSLNFKHFTQQQTYYNSGKGLIPPSLTSTINNPLLNWVAWANLFKMLEEGKFRRKKR